MAAGKSAGGRALGNRVNDPAPVCGHESKVSHRVRREAKPPRATENASKALRAKRTTASRWFSVALLLGELGVGFSFAPHTAMLAVRPIALWASRAISLRESARGAVLESFHGQPLSTHYGYSTSTARISKADIKGRILPSMRLRCRARAEGLRGGCRVELIEAQCLLVSRKISTDALRRRP